ncbi:Uncharacterised protein [Klebsiella oxytoca]|nr:Uncharacterised protein [Klebsiella oxytoca]
MNENNSGLLNYIELLKSHEAALKRKLLAGDKSKSDRWLFIGFSGDGFWFPLAQWAGIC